MRTHPETTADEPQTETSPESPAEHHSLTGVQPPGRTRTELELLKLPQNLKDLTFTEGKSFEEKYRGYWNSVCTVIIFYAIPAFQLVLTYQKVCVYYCE